jgi:hypothetical protein
VGVAARQVRAAPDAEVAQAVKEIFDSTGPAAKVMRKILERHVQSSSVKWWLSHNDPHATPGEPKAYWARKFSSPSQRSVPDYIFSGYVYREYANPDTATGGTPVKFAVEFKAPGKRSTEAQLDEQQKMRDAGWDVYECDDVEKFKEIAQRYL